tara:strand:- start:4208 stop:4396 length:189 start_codon:yes stop_codon:yes gene_type:complete
MIDIKTDEDDLTLGLLGQVDPTMLQFYPGYLALMQEDNMIILTEDKLKGLKEFFDTVYKEEE